MKPTKTLKQACRVLRRRVRYTDAGLTLPGNWMDFDSTKKDTEAIREATRRYVASWIEPIIDAVEAGDTRLLAELVRGERGIEPIAEETGNEIGTE